MSGRKIPSKDEFDGGALVMSNLIAAYELFELRVISEVRTFFAGQETSTGPKVDDLYGECIYRRHPNELRACLMWLRRLDALRNVDLISFDRIRSCRNEISRRMLDCVGTDRVEAYMSAFGELVELMAKFEAWWGMQIGVAAETASHEEVARRMARGPRSLIAVRALYMTAMGYAREAFSEFVAYRQSVERLRPSWGRGAAYTLN